MTAKLRSLTVRGLLGALFTLVVLGASLQVPGANAGAQQRDEPGKVLIITTPRLTWEHVEADQPPNLVSLFGRSAVASTSVRAAGSVTRPADGYLTLGAGNRMASPPTISAGDVAEVTDTLWNRNPSEIFRRTTGETANAPILALSKPQLDRFNDDTYFFGANAGALAGALSSDGRSVAAIGNADASMFEPFRRHVGLAAMDTDGQIAAGMVGTELLRFNAEAPYGLEIDPTVHQTAFERAWADNDVVIAELSDLERAESARSMSSEEQADRQFERALSTSDELVGAMLNSVNPERDTVIVITPTAPVDQVQLTVFSIAGPDIEPGWARSGTTRRDRYVTLIDVAATVLAHYDIATPSGMGDTRISTTAVDTDLESKMATMITDSDRSVLRDRTFGPISVVFVVALSATIVAAILCLAKFPRLNPFVRVAALSELAFLSTTFLLGLFSISTITSLVVGLIGGVAVLVLAALPLRRIDNTMPAYALVGVLWAVLAFDIATGGHLQMNTTFGYSPIVAGRFAGFGNQAYSMIAISMLVIAAGFADRRRPDSEGRATPATVAAIAVWTVVTLVLDGHPSMGSDVGGVLAIVPATAVFLLLIRKIKINLRLAVLIIVATIGVLAAFAGLDLSRAPESRTHLGRFTAELFDGGAGIIIQRKIAANIRVLTSVWSWVIPFGLMYFSYLTWRPTRTFARLMGHHPNYRAFGISAIVLGFLSMALNDSGVSLPAIMVAIVSAHTMYLVMEMERGEARESIDG